MAIQEQPGIRMLDEKKDFRPHDIVMGQYLWFGSWGLVGLAFLAQQGLGAVRLVPGITALLISFFGGIRYSDGPGYYVFRDILVSRRYRRRAGELLAHEDNPSSRSRRGSRQQREPINLKMIGLPVRPRSEAPFTQGVIHYGPSNFDTGFVVGEGWSGNSMDAADRHAAEDLLSEALQEAVQQSIFHIGVTIGIMSRPLNVEGENTFRLTRYHSNAFQPAEEQTVAQRALAKNDAQVRQQSAVGQRDVTQFVSLTVPRPASWPKNRAELSNKVTQREIDQSPLVRCTQVLREGLAANGVKQIGVLNLEELTTFIKSALCLTGIRDWYKARAIAAAKLDRGEETDWEEWPWPQSEIVVGKDYIRVDGTYHRVLRVKTFLRRKIVAGDLMSLYTRIIKETNAETMGFIGAISGQTLSAKKESRWKGRGYVVGSGLRTAFTRGGQEAYLSRAQQDAREEMRRRQDRLDTGGGYALRHNHLIVVSGTSEEALDDCEEIALSVLRGLVNLKRIRLEARQIRNLFNAMGVNGM